MIRLIKLGLDKLAAQLIEPLKPPMVFLLGAYSLIWGLWVANPFWSVFNQSPLFSAMAGFMPEWAWGLIATSLGATLLFGLGRKSYRFLITGAATASWFWLIVCLYYFFGDWESTGGLTAAVFSIHSLFVYLNLKINKKLLGLHDVLRR